MGEPSTFLKKFSWRRETVTIVNKGGENKAVIYNCNNTRQDEQSFRPPAFFLSYEQRWIHHSSLDSSWAAQKEPSALALDGEFLLLDFSSTYWHTRQRRDVMALVVVATTSGTNGSN